MKLADIPDIELNSGLSVNNCNDFINSKKYISKDGVSNQLIMGETILKIVEKGMIKDKNNAVSCKGQAQKLGSEIIDNIIVIAQIKIVLMEENFIINNGEVEVINDHIILDCRPSAAGCRTMDKTYIWGKGKSNCPIRKIRNLNLKEDKGYLVDEQANVLLKKLGTIPAPAGCTNSILYQTEYEGIFLSEGNGDFENIQDKVHISTFIKSRDDYTLYVAEKKLEKLQQTILGVKCKNRFEGKFKDGEITRLDNTNNFAVQKGETTYVFACDAKRGKVETRKECYTDIPIKNGYVTPGNRVFSAFSTKIDCSLHFPTTVRAEESWIELRPTPTAVAKPQEFPLDQHEAKHTDLSAGGLYTDEEVLSWENHLENARYHHEVLHRISHGVCLNAGRCQDAGEEQTGYDLNLLASSLSKELGWWNQFKEQLKEYTALLCALVLVLEMIKFLTTVAALTMALIREGITGLMATLALICCPAHYELKKIRKRAKRRLRERNLEEDPSTPLQDLEGGVVM